ncbi:hypothetical protein ACFPIJ_29330 [Dactylosporangium cerinum]|uniref:Uncharacterized protein n=1 Tax=Dactylosporangium cerinum TaxID=1434730 RepID=A0ABV9W2L2_9ACTN
MRQFEEIQADLLEWMPRRMHENAYIGIGHFFKERRIPLQIGLSILAQAVQDGFLATIYNQPVRTTVEIMSVDNPYPQNGCPVRLTSKGIDYVAAREQRRADPVLRQPAVRNAMMWWLRERDPEGARWTRRHDFVASAHNYFEGKPFTSSDVEQGVIDLEEGGSIRTMLRILLKLSPEGQALLETAGDVSDYLKMRR